MKFRWIIAAVALLGGTLARARLPDWAQPLVTEDVSDLGRGHASVVLADLGEIRFEAGGHVRKLTRGGVRVLTENGKAAAVCRTYYNSDTERILQVRAWIVSADGKQVESVATQRFVDTVAQVQGVSWGQQRMISFSAADRVELNGALFWEFELESQVGVFDQTWYFPREVPMLVCAFDAYPPPGGRVAWHRNVRDVPSPSTAGVPGSLHWELRRYRPPPREARPAYFLATPLELEVRAIAPDTPFPQQTWGDIARLAAGVIEPRIGSDSALVKAQAASLVAGKSDPWDRVRAVAEFVQRDITYLAITLDKDCLAGYRPHPPGEVLGNRFGDCKDKATLLVAMLRAIGVEAHVVLVFSGNPLTVQPDWPSPRFNHAIVAIAADDRVPTTWPVVDAGKLGKMVIFDPTSQYTPLGVLYEADQAGHGLIVAADSAELVELPSDVGEEVRTIDLRIANNGGCAATVVETLGGALAANAHGVREQQASTRFERAWINRLTRTIPSLSDFKWSDEWHPESGQWRLEMKFRADEYPTHSGDLTIVSPLVDPLSTGGPWRTELPGVVWSRSRHVQEHIRIALPPGAEIVELPEGWKYEAAKTSASVRYRRESNAVVCETELSVAGGFLGREEYDLRRDVWMRWLGATRRPIVMKIPKTVVIKSAAQSR